MATSGSPDMAVEAIIQTLESDTTAPSERVNTYAKLSRLLRENDLSLFSLDVCKNVAKICVIIEKDILHESAEVCQEALQVFGICLHDSEMMRNLSVAEACAVAASLCQCVLKTSDKTTCTRALWCAGKQDLPAEAVQKQLHSILCAVEHAIDTWSGQSITVEHECVNTVARLLEQAPKQMEPHSVRWGRVLLILVAHNAVKVRERVLSVIETAIPLLKSQQKELVSSVVPDFKSKICAELKKLLANKQEQYVLKCWGLLVQIFGEEMHRGSFVNSMLPIVELGFKSVHPEVKTAAFSAWQALIDNFATNPSILGDPKRIKLIMQVFRLNNAKVESVAMAKLNVWWHFIWMLNNKVSANFDQVALPLIKFCKGGQVTTENSGAVTPRNLKPGTSPVTPKMNLTMASSSSTYYPVFPDLQLRGCEVLAQFLGEFPEDLPVPEYTFKLSTLRQPVVTGSTFFVKHAARFITSAVDMFISLGRDMPEGLLCRIWYSLIAHIKNAIDSPVKTDVRETLNLFLSQFQVLILSRAIPSDVLVGLFQAVCCLPKKALCSTAYNIGGGQMINGTPALFLMELLLTPVMLQSSTNIKSYFGLFTTIISCGIGNSSGTLSFLHSVLELLDRNAEFVEDPETLHKFWTAVVDPLLEHVVKTNEVNQGDALEHNFGCIYEALIFPVSLTLPSKLSQAPSKGLLKTWTELYKTSARLTAMVTNAEANIVCENICQRIIDLMKDQKKMDAEMLESIVQSCQTIVSCLDFSSLGNHSAFNLNLSPAKYNKRRQRPLENIHSLVVLLCRLQNEAVDLVASDDKGSWKSQSGTVSLQGILNTLVDIFSTLFTHVTTSTVILHMIGQLAQPIGRLYLEASKKSVGKLYNNAFQQKLEKLWMEISTCVQSRYTSFYDTEFLHKISPLLEATFLHSRRQIKNQAMILWNSTFSTATSLDYPDSLKPVLSKVKDKSSLQLPGWVATETFVVEETPVSQMTQSQAPEPHIPGMPSPHKIHGSFLNKAVSPGVKKSPARPPAVSPHRESAKKKVLTFNDFRDSDFVVIRTSPRKKHVLTEHQKEVMKERRTLPAMYNSLEISQDASMMSQFNTDTQQDDSTPTPTSESVVLFGSVVPAHPVKTAKEKPTAITETGAKGNSSVTQKEKSPSHRRSERLRECSSQPFDTAVSVTDHIDVSKPQQTTPSDGNGDSGKTEDKVEDKDMENCDSVGDADCSEGLSVPQNQLGLRDFMSLTSSGSEKSNDKTDEKSVSSSQPLFNWTQKLNELNQSPANKGSQLPSNEVTPSPGKRSRSPLKKSFSQEAAKSPSRKPSPAKSPRRSRKQFAKENEGNLDSWIIRSPNKPTSQEKNTELENVTNTQTVMSVTYVEETQSPTKFSKSTKDDISVKENSILETPPKLMSEVPFTFSVSGRKLFQESQNQMNIEIVEDSNIVPASPNSKLITGSPILKLRRLTDDEILQYSPRRQSKYEQNATPTKEGQSREVDVDLDDCHEHDDFSEIRPLFDSEQSDKDGFQLSDVDKVMLEMTNAFDIGKGEHLSKNGTEENAMQTDKEVKGNEYEKDSKQNSEKSESLSNSGKEYNPCLNSTLKDGADMSQGNVVSDFSSQNESTIGTNSSQDSQSQEVSSFNIEAMDTLLDSTPRRSSRKRKQGTPKKFSPDDYVGSKRKRKDLEAGSSPASVKKSKKGDSQDEELSKDNLTSDRIKTKKTRKSLTPKEVDKAVEKDAQKRENKDGSVAVLDVDSAKVDETKTDPEKETKKTGKNAKEKIETVKNSKKVESTDQCGEKSLNADEKQKKAQTVSDHPEKILSKDKDLSDDLPSSQDRSSQKESIKVAEQIKEVAQKTPESRNSSKPPERKSTTKKKKEVAQKRVKQIRRDVIVIDSDLDSNLELDSDSSDDNSPLIETKRKITRLQKKCAAEEESVEKNRTSSAVVEEEEVLAENILENEKERKASDSLSFTSDDDVPLRCLIDAKIKKNQSVKKKILSRQEGLKTTKTSPVLAKLRSGNVKTRLRSSEKKKSPSPRHKKSVSLALKRTRGKSPRVLKLNDKSEEGTGTQSQNETTDEVEINTESVEIKENHAEENKEKSEQNDEKNDKTVEDKVPDILDSATEKSEEIVRKIEEKVVEKITEVNATETAIEPKNNLLCTENLDETPRKSILSPKRSAASLFMRNSDSKLLITSRRFDKRPGSSRRSILKPSLAVHDDVSSPKKDFSPIRVGRIYSPTASPSASILKKRRLSESASSDSYSPPAKHRRVSFAEPLTDADLVLTDTARTEAAYQPSPLVSSSDSKLTTASDKFFTTSSVTQNLVSSTQSSCETKETQSTQSSTPSQNSYHSTQESQLKARDPVYPQLLECQLPVEKILPQLTSSMWSRGLGQLVRARNIHTIGDLSALTESEVHSLPIRAPKVETVRKVLDAIEQNLKSKQSKTSDSGKEKGPDEEKSIPVPDTSGTSDAINDKTEQGGSATDDKVQSSSIESILTSSGQLSGEVVNLVSSQNQSKLDQSHDMVNQLRPDMGSSASDSSKDGVNTFLSSISALMTNNVDNDLSSLRTEELFQAHQLVTSMQNKIVGALREKCQSSNS